MASFIYLFFSIELNPYSESFGIWLVFAFSVLYMSFGIYQFLQGYFTKKTKRFEEKRAKKLAELDKAIEHYRILVENSNDIIYRTDLKGTLTYVNPVAVRITGYSEEELLGKHSMELIRPDHRQMAELFYTNLLLSKTENTDFELPVLTKSGKELWLEQKIQLLKKGNTVVGVQAVARDITARRIAEQQLRSNEELFQQFVKYTPAAVAMFDRDMQYMAVSDRWIEDFSIDEEAVIGKSYYDLFPNIPDEWVEIHQSCLTGVSYKCEEEPFQREDGTVDWLQWEVHPWYEVPGKVGGLIMFKELITGRKQAEETLLKRKELAENASRTKSNFIGRMSHELRTPLTSILGFAQMLEIDPSLTQGQLNQINQIKGSGEYLLEIINDLLELSNIETGKIEFEGEDLNLDRLIKEIVANQSGKYSVNNNRFHLDMGKKVPGILHTDAKKLRMVLSNLIGNAYKFTYNGDITVTSDITPVKDSGADALLEVAITDTGSGIPSEKLESIFQPFTQAKEMYNQGTGLGLALSYKFCRFLGGSIEADSEVGTGSTFTVKIPVQIRKTGGRVQNEELSEPEMGNPKTDITPKEVGRYIKSLDKEQMELIHSALEIQDMETISKIDKQLGLTNGDRNVELKKLKRSAENNDYLFITLVNRELEES